MLNVPLNRIHSHGKDLASCILVDIRFVSWSAIATDVPNTRSANPKAQLVILYNEESRTAPATPDQIVAAVTSSERSVQSQAIVTKLETPARAKFLTSRRQSLAYRSRLDRDSPPDLFQRYVVLTYTDEAAADSAYIALSGDPDIRSISRNAPMQFAVAPADPYYAIPGNNFTWQWALHQTELFLTYAWDQSPGHAYIGHVDAGIAVAHPDLQQAFRPQFSWDTFGETSDVDETLIWQLFRGHGSHTAGIIAATNAPAFSTPGYPNASANGVAGVCWYCSLMVAKTTNSNGIPDLDAVADAIHLAVISGAQIINLSLGIAPDSPDRPDCTANPLHPWCEALTWAQARDVLVVAAAGNRMRNELDFPASDFRTLAVGATQSYQGTRGLLWTEETFIENFGGSSTGPGMATRGVVAPGRDILSTVYPGFDYNTLVRCGDFVAGAAAPVGYGVCTGTSMATAMVTGVAALARSINPLASATDLRTILLYTASNAASPNESIGFGTPNASLAVYASKASNQLTPLFSFWGIETVNYFYTTVPQMGAAAVTGTMPPAVNNDWDHNFYQPVGSLVTEYPSFPNVSGLIPRAQVWVFTSPSNPRAQAPLRPLYRLSFRCGDFLPPGASSSCDAYPYHVDHFYSTDYAEVQTYVQSAGYRLDGIEGYVYPADQPQPWGTEALRRAYNPQYDDHAIFPGGDEQSMVSSGWTVNRTSLGFVYRNYGARPTY
jgi:serine protease